MTPAEFDDRLHALLDARRDPLADRACTEFLAEHPERMAATGALLDRLMALPAVAPTPIATRRTLRRPLPWVMIAAACAAVGALFVPRADAADDLTRPSGGRVLAASLQPIEPLLQPTATIRARTVLLDAPGAQLEVFTQWSPP